MSQRIQFHLGRRRARMRVRQKGGLEEVGVEECVVGEEYAEGVEVDMDREPLSNHCKKERICLRFRHYGEKSPL